MGFSFVCLLGGGFSVLEIEPRSFILVLVLVVVVDVVVVLVLRQGLEKLLSFPSWA